MADRSDAHATDTRLRRLEALDELLHTLTGVLDVREIFARVSEIAQKVLPHDLMSLLLISDDRSDLILHAMAGSEMQFPQVFPVPDHLRALTESSWDYLLYPDVQLDPIARTWPPSLLGYRAAIAVPVRLNAIQVASLDLWSYQPEAFCAADALILRRIADHVALALSHQRLSEEAARAAEARERAGALERRVRALTAEVESLGGVQRIIGRSTSWKRVLKQATQVAATDTTAMLLGESGTGKEVIARFIHRASARSGGPFVALNCAALPEQLLESELFGFERGAFTGAQNAKPGQLEQAAGGTLFLDEVSEMSLAAQAKFLRVLQEKEFQRLGGTRTIKASARVIAATNRDLHAEMEKGTFREDLYYRLHVFEIALPPLRERREDVLPLSEAFLAELAKAFGRPPAGISRDARQILMEYHWPGNVRQLRNTLERAAILCEGGLITAEHLSLPPRSKPASEAAAIAQAASIPTEVADLRSMERTMIENALKDARHNKSKAAKQLGLTRTQLYVRLKKYGLDA